MLTAESPNTTLIKIAVKSELPARGRVREFMASGRMLCLANIDDNIYATDNACLHWGGPLGQGRIEDGKMSVPGIDGDLIQEQEKGRRDVAAWSFIK